jgi:hypothetical protein
MGRRNTITRSLRPLTAFFTGQRVAEFQRGNNSLDPYSNRWWRGRIQAERWEYRPDVTFVAFEDSRPGWAKRVNGVDLTVLTALGQSSNPS